jgi:hypothetical protein
MSHYLRVSKQLGRLPKRAARGSEEARAFEWARRQRRRFDALSAEQYAALDAIPGFSWDPHADRWSLRLEALVAFETASGRLPRRNVEEPGESSLARWRERQFAAVESALSHNRLTALAALEPNEDLKFDPLYESARVRLSRMR